MLDVYRRPRQGLSNATLGLRGIILIDDGAESMPQRLSFLVRHASDGFQALNLTLSF